MVSGRKLRHEFALLKIQFIYLIIELVRKYKLFKNNILDLLNLVFAQKYIWFNFPMNKISIYVFFSFSIVRLLKKDFFHLTQESVCKISLIFSASYKINIFCESTFKIKICFFN